MSFLSLVIAADFDLIKILFLLPDKLVRPGGEGAELRLPVLATLCSLLWLCLALLESEVKLVAVGGTGRLAPAARLRGLDSEILSGRRDRGGGGAFPGLGVVGGDACNSTKFISFPRRNTSIYPTKHNHFVLL